MSDTSEKDFFDNEGDSADRSVHGSDKDVDEYDGGTNGRGGGQAPDDEDMEHAGYGGRDQYGPEEVDEQVDDNGDDMMEMQMDKDDGSIDQFDDDDAEANYGEPRTKKRLKKGDGRDRERSRGERRERGDRGDVEKAAKKKKKPKREAEEAEEDEYIEENYDRMGSKKGKKRRKDEDANDNEVESIKELVREMDNAYEEDIQCFKAKMPAVNKLKLLPKVEAVLKRGAFQKAFIDRTDGLDAMSKWLTKLPNGATPSLQIKKKLVDIIYQLPVTDEHLKDSDIGRVVYTLRSNQNEDPDLKRVLKDIVDKWTRLITDSANDYAPAQVDVRDRKRIEVSLDDYRQRGMSSLKKSIPRMVNKRSGFDFVHKPQMKESMRSINPRQQSNEECDKIIKDMKRKMRKEFK